MIKIPSRTKRSLALFLSVWTGIGAESNAGPVFPPVGEPAWRYSLAEHPAPPGSIAIAGMLLSLSKVDSAGNTVLILPFVGQIRSGDLHAPITGTRVVWINPEGKILYTKDDIDPFRSTALILLTPEDVILTRSDGVNTIKRTLEFDEYHQVKVTEEMVNEPFLRGMGADTPKGTIRTSLSQGRMDLEKVEFAYYPPRPASRRKMDWGWTEKKVELKKRKKR